MGLSIVSFPEHTMVRLVANDSRSHFGLTVLLIVLGAILSIYWYIHVAVALSQQSPLTYRESPRTEQWAVVISFFGIKTIYTILTAIIIFALRHRREGDLVALRWSMISFFIGEAFCFVNVMAFHDNSVPMEHLHSLGMVLSIAFGIYALLEGVDARIIHYSDVGRCAFASMCDRCAKHVDVLCGLRRSFILMLPLLALAAAMPLYSSFRDTAYTTHVLGANHIYRHSIVHQVYELRYLPAAAIALFAACLLMVSLVERRSMPVSKILLAAASGAMTFSFFRLMLVASYIDNQVWFAVWEETLELLTILAIGGVLYLFRARLLAPDTPKGANDAAGSLSCT